MEKTKAVALKYNEEVNNAPYILAKGVGEIGKYIVSLAKKNNIPVYKNDKLAESLYRLKQNEEIPPELYSIVAEIFIFVYALKEKK
ncbi:MAG: EscU/YscU/HrcU family type III secretion system export apparatus switch protein [Brevinematales bacterium]|nr:EscU/YscU/HrcU family type III secretion system export apparatus switch protein [Brevinematales bacterium]